MKRFVHFDVQVYNKIQVIVEGKKKKRLERETQ